MLRYGVVSFLNSRPLIEGLAEDRNTELIFDVPANLEARLTQGGVDVALVPLIDVIRSAGSLRPISDAGIACDGETMTVRVFSQIPPDRVTTLDVDGDSHTSIALASVLWQELYQRRIAVQPIDARTKNIDDCRSVLLIGDKVITGRRGGFAYEVDLGAAWRQHTGLPFVFAVWAARTADVAAQPERYARAAEQLSAARDSGVARAREIAERDGPPRWWPVDLATKYLTRCLKYRLDARMVEGAERFARLCGECGLAPHGVEIQWPESLRAGLVV